MWRLGGNAGVRNLAWVRSPAEHVGGGAGIVEDGRPELFIAGEHSAAQHEGVHRRQQLKAVGVDLPTAVRMATLTPAKILGMADSIGSLSIGRRADVVLLDRELAVRCVFVGGDEIYYSEKRN